MKNKTLTELFLAKMPKSEDIARKLLKDVQSCTKEEIGRALLSTRKPNQRIVNLEPRK